MKKGKEIFEAKAPKWAKGVIVAFNEVNDCDYMSDYFNAKPGLPILLAWSKNIRDTFSEMRKGAKNLDETAHLGTKPKVNDSGNEKNDENKDWWHPCDEHREKYSMGRGYYLKKEIGYSTGWVVRKKHIEWSKDMIYLALGEGRVCESLLK